MILGALILTGGGSSRMRADKASLDWAGERAVDRVAAVARQVGATEILTVGALDYGWPSVVEEPAGGGPAAGAAAGAARLRTLGCDSALLLAVDAPSLRPDDLAPLIEAGRPGAAYADLHLPLVVWLDAVLPEAAPGWSMARFITEAGLRLVSPAPEAEGRLRGANTPEERAALLAELAGRGA